MKTIKPYLLGLLTMILFLNGSCQSIDTSGISNQQFKQIATGKDVVILDVRTAEEYKAGFIPMAVNIDVLQEEAFKKQIASLPKDKTYLLYCRAGKRSATALGIMKENGFTNIKHLQKGFAAWDGAVQQ
jgi:rhodanese-related sulfurtransferase